MTPLFVRRAACAVALFALALPAVAQAQVAPAALPTADRPFGGLREQAAMQQAWLKKRLDTFLPALLRKHAIDMWVVPMREIQRIPGVLVDHRAGNLLRATAHDLRVLRQVRRRQRAGDAGLHRADRARRDLAGRRGSSTRAPR